MKAPNTIMGFVTIALITAVAVWILVPLVGKVLPQNTITV